MVLSGVVDRVVVGVVGAGVHGEGALVAGVVDAVAVGVAVALVVDGDKVGVGAVEPRARRRVPAPDDPAHLVGLGVAVVVYAVTAAVAGHAVATV